MPLGYNMCTLHNMLQQRQLKRHQLNVVMWEPSLYEFCMVSAVEEIRQDFVNMCTVLL